LGLPHGPAERSDRWFLLVFLQGLKKRINLIAPAKVDEVKNIRKTLGDKSLGKCTVEQVRFGSFC
jgi:hypothetical protein